MLKNIVFVSPNRKIIITIRSNLKPFQKNINAVIWEDRKKERSNKQKKG